MALNDILGTAVSGLAAAQAGLRAVSNNIANVGVAGYARERVNLTTGVVSGQVSGVVVGEPTRVADRFLEATVYNRAGDYGRTEVTANYLDRLQALLGQPGASSGLSARLDAVSASAVAMTGSLGSTQTVAQFTNDVQDAISSMQQMDNDVSQLRSDVESEVGYSVDKINTLLKRIYDLNGTVAQATGLGRSAGGAADQRMSAIEELSGLMQVTVRDQADGRVTIETANGQMLLDKRLRQLSYPSAGGASQPTYPAIEIRFAQPDAATGDKIDSAAIGGKLGGLLDLRDRALPAFSEQLGTLFTGLSQALNSVSNAGSTVPPPAALIGRNSGMAGSDRLGFAGAATFAVTKADGTLVASTKIDFDALGPNATIDDMVTAINTGLGGAGTASFADGKLSIVANGAGNGVAIGQDATKPSARAGQGVSQFFGLNDLVRSDSSSLVPSGFAAGDPHGFATGETTQIVLRDSSGRALTSYTLTPATGGTFGDLVNDLNGSPLSNFGTFSLDDSGRLRFAPAASVAGATLSIPADSTNRLGTGRSFAQMMNLTGASSGLGSAQVRPDILADSSKLGLARLQDVAAGAKALGSGDTRGATAFVNKLGSAIDLGKDGKSTVDAFASNLMGRIGLDANQAKGQLADATARRDDAITRRDSFAGVNIDEELSQMVVLQNSYSAAARVISTANDMYDTLLGMLRQGWKKKGRPMTRVATIPLQRTMASAISRAQEQLADTQRQLSTRKKAATFADLGTEAVRNLSAHSLLARQDAQATVSKRVGTTLSLYQANLEGIDDATSDLRTSLMKAVGTGDSAGLQEAIQTAFDQFRTSLNASEGGTPLFGGSQVDQAPFSVDTLAQAATTPGASAFHNDTVRANARVADGVDISYGVGASEIGANLYEAFRTLGQAGDIGTKPTDAQMDAIKQAVAQLNTGLGDVRAINADNGRKQNQVDTLTARGEARGLVLQGVIQDNEDADLGQVAIDLAQQKTVLEASYSVFAQLSGLNLAAYLK